MGLSELSAALLCGGLGTRLRPLVADRQKTMAAVGAKPFLQILVEWAAAQGLRRFVFCVGYQGEQVEDFFRGRYPGLDLVFSRESSPLGTAGALKHCEKLLGGATSLVFNGDSFCPLDLASFLDFHRRRPSVASLAVASAGSRTDGGTITLDDDGRIIAFEEKTARTSGRLNAGIYLLEPAALAAIPAGRPCSIEKELFPALLDRGVYGHETTEPLYDIGTPERLEEFRRIYALQEATP